MKFRAGYRSLGIISSLLLSAPGQTSLVNNTAPTIPVNHIRIHYARPDGDYAGWTLYAFGDTEESTNYDEGSLVPAGIDSYGAYFDIKLTTTPRDLGFIVHNVETGVKDPGPDMHVNVATCKEAWMISQDATVYSSKPAPAQIFHLQFSQQQAFWIDHTTIAIPAARLNAEWSYTLVYSPRAALKMTATGTVSGAADTIALTLYASGLTAGQKSKFPQLSAYAALHLPGDIEISRVKQLLKGQVALASVDKNGALRYMTGLQPAGVLDELFRFAGKLGPCFRNSDGDKHKAGAGVRVSVWAPTAQSVKLLLFSGEADNAPEQSIAMEENNGVWSATGDYSWHGKYYLLDVLVYVPRELRMVENIVTDPYSTDLALNGVKTRITDLKDPSTKPIDWDETPSPVLRSKNDLSLYEMHIRDFSSHDPTVEEELRGTYLAFTDPTSAGMQHLKNLAEAGLKAVHLLPSFHFASVNEDKSTWKSPGDLSKFPPDSEEQQAAVAQVQNEDGFNWGYDPVHYMAPEGSYAVNPNDRVKEYREMVLALHKAGLRVVQDQVFNHTDSAGQTANSVLDKIVPGYYHRLDANGNVRKETCCSDTASEHRMMEKLMIDTIVQNAREYKIDGFRFDLMGFHFVSNMENIGKALSALTLDRDGVDGSKIYLYGEGWGIGAPAHNALGLNASQVNMFGTGVGTFNDRIRDGIRGPSWDGRAQGFATGLLTDPSDYTARHQRTSDQHADLLNHADWIKAGLAGNMRDFTFESAAGQIVKAADIKYGGSGAAYTASPVENVNYCSVHDNKALFDAVQLKAAIPGTTENGGDGIEIRARRQILAMSLVALGQGIPFFLAGDDLLHSKDMDENSYDSGDWFNKLDFTYQSNNWGIGLPPASHNLKEWLYMRPLLANSSLKAKPANIAFARDAFRELLRIRESSLLFRMSSLSEVQSNLHFFNNGPHQIPGLIVMLLEANGGSYGTYERLVVVFNARRETIVFQNDALKGLGLHLHPVLVHSSDEIVRGSVLDNEAGSATVPGLTTAVFVAEK